MGKLNLKQSKTQRGAFCALIVTAAVLLSTVGCQWLRPGRPAGAVAEVNGKPITEAELNRLVEAQTAGSQQKIGPEQQMRLKLTLLNQMIDRQILLQYAAHEGVVASQDEIAKQEEVAKTRQPQLTAEDLKQEAQDSVILDKLIKREVNDRVQITDAQIDDFYQKNKASFNVPEPEYHIQEIVVTPHPGQVSNLANDKAQNDADARKKIQMISDQIKQGKDFNQLAQQYSEDPNTAGSGGDLGLIPQSALMSQAPDALRQAVLALRPGEISPVIKTPQAYFLLKLVDKEQAGMRESTDPRVRKAIRDLLTNSQQQLLRTAFLTVVRDQARVTNYLAQDVLHQGGKAE